MIKALFFDLDGTLLRSDKRISPKTYDVLRRCRRDGVKVFVVTGRNAKVREQLRLSPDEAEVILSDGGVYQNGGCVCYGRTRHYTTLQSEAARRAVEIAVSYPETNLAVQLPGDRQSFRHDLGAEDYALWGVEPHELVGFGGLSYDDVVKIVIFSPAELLPALHTQLSGAIGAAANVYLCGSDFRSIDISDKATNKRTAVERVMGLCGIGPDEVAVFGDDHNDLEMLAGFPNSVAMGNACAEAKAAAAHIAPSNDEEGIYHAIREFFGLV